MLTALKAGTRYSIIRGVLQASLMEGAFLVPALPPYIIEPVWEQFRALLPQREIDHPLGCHRPRISDRVIFEKLVQVLVFGCSYRRIADEGCSATTLRERRDEWIELGAMEALREKALAAYDRLIGLDLLDVAVDGCITKAPCGGEKAGRSPVDRGKQGIKRSIAVDALGIPLGAITAPANRHDSPLLAPTLDAEWSRHSENCPRRRAFTSTAATIPSSPASAWKIGVCSGRSPRRTSRHRSGPPIGGW